MDKEAKNLNLLGMMDFTTFGIKYLSIAVQ